MGQLQFGRLFTSGMQASIYDIATGTGEQCPPKAIKACHSTQKLAAPKELLTSFATRNNLPHPTQVCSDSAPLRAPTLIMFSEID
eukprot:3953538-Amphidinium_carterae.1